MTTTALLRRAEVSHPTGVRRALIVEDQPDIGDLIEQIIHPLGFETYRASDGDEAVRLARAVAPSLITLDLKLPVKDGHSVLRELASEPATRDIPVIVISAYTDRLQPTRQVVGVFEKPFEVKELEDLITLATSHS